MKRRPVIGVAACLEQARWSFWDQPAHLVSDSYVSALVEAGGVPVLLPVTERPPSEVIDQLDALVLIGGADIDPSTYGAERDPATEATFPLRDRFELAVTEAALARGIPFLGICRGMQLLNVARGGTLRQHYTDAQGDTTHRRAQGSFVGTEGTMLLDPGSLVAAAIGGTEHVGHCHHHQIVERLGDGLTVTARAALDGAPEAIEDTDGRWVLGVQWHPEASEERALFRSLVTAASGASRAASSASTAVEAR